VTAGNFAGDPGLAGNKEALRDRFWLRKTSSPLVAYVGRLDEQKGMQLVHHALFHTLDRGGQFVLMGDANYHDGINDHFWRLKDYLNDDPDCHLEIGYREELAHLIYAGANLLVRAAPSARSQDRLPRG
jgi:starch synthase